MKKRSAPKHETEINFIINASSRSVSFYRTFDLIQCDHTLITQDANACNKVLQYLQS